MRIQSKTFYADLFSKSPSTAKAGADIKPRPAALTAIKPMAPLAPALSSKTRSPDQAPGQAAQQTARETASKNATEKALALPAPADLPAPVPVRVGAVSANDEGESPAPPAAPKRSALTKLIGNTDIHHMSPRQMTHLSQTLYAAGALSFEDYSQLAFQPELHPDYERTIGALTGEHAAPDRRRDFVSLWNERADFQRRHNSGRPDLVEQSERIASVLSRIETPMNVMA